MHPEKHLPELMAEKNSLDPSFVHAVRLLAEGKSGQEDCPFLPSHLHLMEMPICPLLLLIFGLIFREGGGHVLLVLVGTRAQLFCHLGEQLPLQKFYPQSSRATFSAAETETAAAAAFATFR